MKIKTRHELLVLNLLNIVLIIIVIFLPSNVLRVILGIPFILFFPGYTLISALFPVKDAMSGSYRVILGFALSVALVPLILLVLNFTSWGITLNPILFSVAAFTAAFSVGAWFRRRRLPESYRSSVELELNMPVWKNFWQTGIANRIISIVLVIVILGATGILVYVISTPDMPETYTEFYILNEDGEVGDYSRTLGLGESRTIIVGIINHENVPANYRIEVRINNIICDDLGPISLGEDEKWESEVILTPASSGYNQKVEFVLYKNGEVEPYMDPLHFWIDVRE